MKEHLSKIKYIYKTYVDSSGTLHSIKKPVVYSNKEYFIIREEGGSRVEHIQVKSVKQPPYDETVYKMLTYNCIVWSFEPVEMDIRDLQIKICEHNISLAAAQIKKANRIVEHHSLQIRKQEGKIDSLRQELKKLQTKGGE